MNLRSGTSRLVGWLVAICVFIIVTAVGSVLFDSDEGSAPNGEPTFTIATGAPTGDLAAVDPQAEGRATIRPPDSELRDETPEGVPAKELRAAKDRVEGLPPLQPKPVGGAQNYQVRQKIDYEKRTWGTRDGVRPRLACLHYTVSGNVVGWGDIYAVDSYFLRSRVGSATFIADFEGNILQEVPRDGSPWTQGWFNDYCISWEIIATGSETRQQWLASPLIKDRILSSHVRDELRRMGATLQWVDPIGCGVPAAGGWTDHNAFECGNDHHDVLPNFPYDVFAQQLLDGACDRVCKQKKVVDGRAARHRELHAAYVKAGCRRGMHERRLREYTRRGCQALKRKGHSQHLGQGRARAKLRRLRRA